MRLVVLLPAGGANAQDHYRDTVRTPVNLSAHQSQLGAEGPVLSAAFPTGMAPLWGATPKHRSAYGRITSGDFVLFAGKSRLFAGATVVHTFHNATLAKQLWGRDGEGQLWELMLAVSDLRDFDIPYAEMNRVVGYKPNNNVQGFSVLDDAKSAALFDYLGLDNDAHPPAVSTADYETLVDRYDGGTETAVTAERRREQAYLRQVLLPGTHGECALCGRTFPVQFLVAAHIKKRAACTVEEKLHIPWIAMAACKLGCDTLFEQGFIAVDASGAVVVSPHVTATGAVADYLAPIAGRPCGAASPTRQPYFEWHRTHTYRSAPENL